VINRRVIDIAGPLVLALVGCKTLQTPAAVVAPQVEAANKSSAAWLESATLTYNQVPAAPCVATGAVSTASYAPTIVVSQPTKCGRVRVLAVRYPHPDGRRDVGRAELITADASTETTQTTSWRDRLDRMLSGTLPGLEWGPGIQQAKGLDLPLAELKNILAEAGQPAINAPAASTSQPDIEGRLEINGQHCVLAASAEPAFNALADRVNRQGRLISYAGSAADLLAATSAR
jgi:hypothetical protein